MKFDFSSLPLRNKGFSDQPMAFIDPEPRAMLSAIMEMALIETGNPTAREHWQKAQLRHLLTHASQRSGFWQKRLGSKKLSDVKLGSLPVLTRQDLLQQVRSEGPLLQASDGIATQTEATSGSSGTPVRFFVSEINGRYNAARSLAQYFHGGLGSFLKPNAVEARRHVWLFRRKKSVMDGATGGAHQVGRK